MKNSMEFLFSTLFTLFQIFFTNLCICVCVCVFLSKEGRKILLKKLLKLTAIRVKNLIMCILSLCQYFYSVTFFSLTHKVR